MRVLTVVRAVSLYLGRMPTLTELPFDHSPELCTYLFKKRTIYY